MLAAIDRIPPPVRGALATLVMLLGARYGVEITESAATAILVVVLWAVLGIADVVRERRKRGAE